MKKTSIGVVGAVAAAYLAYSPANATTTSEEAIGKPPASEAALTKLQRAWDTKVAQRSRKFCEVVGSGAPPCDKQ
jgi:hypothetical protein